MPRLQPAVFTDSDLFLESLDDDFLRLESRPVWTLTKAEVPVNKAFAALDNLDLRIRPKPIVDVDMHFRCPLMRQALKNEIKATVAPQITSHTDGDGDVEMGDSVDSAPCVAYDADANSDGEIEMDDPGSSEADEVSDDEVPEEQVVIEELRIKAISLKEKLMERWIKKLDKDDEEGEGGVQQLQKNKKGHKRQPQSAGASQKGTVKCSYEDCPWSFNTRAQTYKRHIHTHYPYAYFCPVCGEIVCREDSLDRHLQNKGKGQCTKSTRAKRFQIAYDENGKVKIGMDRKYFNLYYLGVMEEYVMPEEHFEIIAKRRRRAPLQ